VIALDVACEEVGVCMCMVVHVVDLGNSMYLLVFVSSGCLFLGPSIWS
jgi:hypothetical protein